MAKATTRRTTPYSKALNTLAKDPATGKKNNKGEITSWSSTSNHGRLLKMLIENGNILPSQTAGEVRSEFPTFCLYSYNTFSSALSNARKSYSKHVEARMRQTGRGGKEGEIKAFSNLEDISDDDESFKLSNLSVQDDLFEYDDEVDDKLSMGKSVTFDDKATVQSYSTNPRKSFKSKSGVAVSTSTLSGFKSALPYIIDYWYDRNSARRVSIQIHMLSGSNALMDRVTYRVSSNQKEFVLTMPISEYISNASKGLHLIALNGITSGVEGHKQVLDYHPKIAARRLQISKMKKADINVMEFRIPLGIMCKLDYANVTNNDPYFYGNKFTAYPDGSLHLHVELLGDMGRGHYDERVTTMKLDVPDSVSIPSSNDSDDESYMDITLADNASLSGSISTKSFKSTSSKSTRSKKSTTSAGSKKSTASARSTRSTRSNATGATSTPKVIVDGYNGPPLDTAPARKSAKRTAASCVVTTN